MQNITLICTIIAIHIIAWFAPCPLIVLIIRNSLVYSRKSGIWTAVGIALGTFVHISYCVVGIWLVTSISDTALEIIKFLGVGYLAYLGVKTLLIKVDPQKSATESKAHKDISPFNAAKIGFITNTLGPSLFFASIFATIIASGTPFWVVVFLWVAMPLTSFVMASLFSVFFTQKSFRTFYVKYQYFINMMMGLSLLVFAFLIAFHK
jgi:threonine/homoserine/homoserine lactone efflux protein